MDLIQILNLLILIAFVVIGYLFISPSFSFRINKPYAWEDAFKKGSVSTNVKKLEKTYPDKVRFYSFWLQIERLKRDQVQGAFAELGVYKGETANLMYEMDPTRILHLLDTFEGFNANDLNIEKNTDKKFNTKNFSDTSLEAVKSYINGNDNIIFHKGYFPETANALVNEKFAFVHLDADLYQPTIEGLRFFYPRMNPGGVIVIHDYNHNWPGVKQAVDEFVKTIPESFVEISDACGSVMIVKCKN